MNKRFASLAVSALLLVSMFSVPALAEGADAAADTAAASDDHVIVTLNPEAALQPETPADAEASATETAKADPDPSAAEAAVSEEKEDKQLTYVALGDSICAGVGLADVQYSARAGYSVDMVPNFKGYSPDCYVGKVAETLGLDRLRCADHRPEWWRPAFRSSSWWRCPDPRCRGRRRRWSRSGPR